MKLADRYQELAPDRDAFLRRARACAALTVPAVAPPEGHNQSLVLPQSYQSLGARGAVNLAAKLLLSFLPPGASSFKLDVPPAILIESGELSPPADIQQKLALVEKLVNTKVEALQWRRPTFVSLLHLIVAGNIAEYVQPNGRIKQFRLDQYVVVRDWSGDLLEIVTCEQVRHRNLPEEVRATIGEAKDAGETHRLYTRFTKKDGTYTFQQDVGETTVKPEATFGGTMPINALGWNFVPSEHYSRSHVEDLYGDLQSYDEHSKNMTEGGALAARHLTFVRPNAAGGNLRKRIAEARNGAVLAGNPEDVTGYQFQNGTGLQIIASELERLQRALSASFLLTSELRRDAERVTAYELRMLVQELEAALGGTYALLATDYHAWRLSKLMAQMESRQELPPIRESVDITITTGLEALGRDETVNKVRSVFELVGTAGQFAQDVSRRIKWAEVLQPGLNALGFPNATKSEDEVQQEIEAEQQALMEQQMVSGIAGPAAQAALSNPEGQ
jgi:hypothetical protein